MAAGVAAADAAMVVDRSLQPVAEQAAMESIRQQKTDLDRYLFLRDLREKDENLFFRLLMTHTEELLPHVYTPTVGEACQKYSKLPIKTHGIIITPADKGKILDKLKAWPEKDIRVIVATDGERILGLGDLGYNGMGISEGKILLYTVIAGVDPQVCLPMGVDVGTNNQSLLDDPEYKGLRQRRLRGPEYDELIDELMAAVRALPSHVLFQFEDFGNTTAFKHLVKYRDVQCCFNDDIQGTACITLAGILSALRVTKQPLGAQQRVLFHGAGEAGTGIAELIAMAIAKRNGIPIEEARKACFFMDSKGLVCKSRLAELQHHKIPFAHDIPYQPSLVEAVRAIRPTVLIGVSTSAGAFTKEVVELMTEINDRPVIFPLSNPTSKSECTYKDAFEWSKGKVVFASGSPFPPLRSPEAWGRHRKVRLWQRGRVIEVGCQNQSPCRISIPKHLRSAGGKFRGKATASVVCRAMASAAEATGALHRNPLTMEENKSRIRESVGRCYDEGVCPDDLHLGEVVEDEGGKRFVVNELVNEVKDEWLKERSVIVVFQGEARTLARSVKEDLIRAYEDGWTAKRLFHPDTRRGRVKFEGANVASYVAKAKVIVEWLLQERELKIKLGSKEYQVLFKPRLSSQELQEARLQEAESRFWIMALRVPLDAYYYLKSAVRGMFGEVVEMHNPEYDRDRPKLMNVKFDMPPDARGRIDDDLMIESPKGERLRVDIVSPYTDWCRRCKWYYHTEDNCPRCQSEDSRRGLGRTGGGRMGVQTHGELGPSIGALRDQGTMVGGRDSNHLRSSGRHFQNPRKRTEQEGSGLQKKGRGGGGTHGGPSDIESGMGRREGEEAERVGQASRGETQEVGRDPEGQGHRDQRQVNKGKFPTVDASTHAATNGGVETPVRTAPTASTHAGMLHYAKLYYMDILTSRYPHQSVNFDLSRNSDMWEDTTGRLQPNARLDLDRPLMVEEVRQTLKTMAKGKSPGVDELTVEFYAANWNAFGPALVNLYNEVLVGGKLGKGMTHKVISMLFKKGDKSEVRNWRPISLLNVSYKMLAKILARRLSRYLPELVERDQGAFVQGFISKAAMDTLSFPRPKGGLGLLDPARRNQAQLRNWVAKLATLASREHWVGIAERILMAEWGLSRAQDVWDCFFVLSFRKRRFKSSFWEPIRKAWNRLPPDLQNPPSTKDEVLKQLLFENPEIVDQDGHPFKVDGSTGSFGQARVKRGIVRILDLWSKLLGGWKSQEDIKQPLRGLQRVEENWRKLTQGIPQDWRLQMGPEGVDPEGVSAANAKVEVPSASGHYTLAGDMGGRSDGHRC
ncbi:hypothetical protein CBR_g3085 [Chara braunii]|uniref:Malic enzyme n=1 Tax=Chara braunii TaxID=69332 RepID=A0A388KES8_CHABU|nr:hypothetical protein CBR_g3085 [Chara braunii]|eukprot:GBG68541.1 hypothetical protein CBR_g3085 [Chara braunii]